MTDPQILLATDVVSTTAGRRPAFPMSWTLPVLAIAMTVCAAGCGTANSDEYEAISDSQIEAAPQATCKGSGFSEQIDGVPDSDPLTFSDVRGGETDLSPAIASPGPGEPGSEGEAVTAEAGTGGSSDTTEAGSPDPPVGAIAETAEPKTELAVVEPREIKLLIPEKKFRKEGRERAFRVTFDDVDLLKILNMEPVQENAPTLMPDWLKGLDGKQIRLRGFMFPTFQDTDIEVFVLARDNDICCFGRFPKVYDLVKVSMKDGETTDYIEGRPFDVVGVFHIAEKASVAKGDLPKLYSITDAVVISR